MMIKRLTRDKAGFSLVEIMFAISIFLIVGAGIYSVFAAGDDTWQANRTKVTLQQELRRGMDGMIFDLRHASTLSIVDVPADGTAYSTITFQMPTNVSGGVVQWSGTNTVFNVNGSNQLTKTEGANTWNLANDISALSFTRTVAEPDILQVSITAQDVTNEGITINDTLDFEVQLRN